jgi:hypothetical protein
MTELPIILRFTFTHPDLHTNIVGTIDPVHLQHNVNVLLRGPLPADVYAEAKRRLDAAGSAPHVSGGPGHSSNIVARTGGG